jgi:hypothetical protein
MIIEEWKTNCNFAKRKFLRKNKAQGFSENDLYKGWIGFNDWVIKEFCPNR